MAKPATKGTQSARDVQGLRDVRDVKATRDARAARATRDAIAGRIKQLRTEHGITQEKFALMIGLNRSYLADIEKGNRNFGIDTLDKIVAGFNLTWREFFSGM